MSGKKNFSSKQLFLYVFGFLTLFAITLGTWIYQDVKQERIKDIKYASSVIKRYYELSFNQWRNSLLSLGQRLLEINGHDQEQRRLDLVNKTLKNYKELLAFGLVDTTGQIMTLTGMDLTDSVPNLTESKNTKRSFLLSKRAKEISIGESYYFSNVNDWVLPIRVPIRDENGILLAINTTAIQYKSLNKELASFGFDPMYRIHLVNKDFNTTQLYYPFTLDRYSEILQKDAGIYESTKSLTSNEISYFEATNSLENHKSIGLKSDLAMLNHQLVVSVDSAIIWDEVQLYVLIIFVLYLILSALLYFYYLSSLKKEKNYVSQLEYREANLKAIFESTSSIIGLFDKNKKLVEFNRSFASYAKQTDGIVLAKGMNVFSEMTGPTVDVFMGYQDRALNGEKFKETVEYPSPDGSYYFLFSYHPIYQKDEITGVSMFVEDITALKQTQIELEGYSKNLEGIVKERTAELEVKNIALESGNEELAATIEKVKNTQSQLVQVEKMASLGILAAGIGHEINNPLNFIQNGLSALNQELIDNKYESMEDITPFVDIINDGINRASKIVKSLSHFSRQQISMDDACDVEEIIEHCLVILQNNLKNKVEVTKEYDQDKVVVLGNEGKLHQAFLNIISNAEQSIIESGNLTISTVVKNNDITVVFKDNGGGIDKENLAKIGDPFFTTKDPGEGTGLGLFIAYSIIDEHNGTIHVESEIDNGSTFEIKLPIK